MNFVFWPLLGGLALAGVPVVIHLLMRQKPKRLVFPALRFLQEGRKSTTRKLKLRHFLLLALRMLLIALLVFALARAYFNHPQLGLGGDQPVAAVLIIDTTPSMEYSVGGKTRLEDARVRARQLLDELPADSRVAILDTAQELEEWSPSLPSARSRLDELQKIVHAQSRARRLNGSVSRQLAAAYRMFERLKHDEPDEKLTPLLVVFSDRTQACWDPAEVRELKGPEHLGAVFVDVGAETTRDLAITDLAVTNDRRVPQQAFLPGQWIHFGVTVEAAAGAQATEAVETEVHFRLTSEKQPEVQSVKLRPGNRQTLWFKRRAGLKSAVGEEIKGLATGQHQAEVQLDPGDELPFNDTRFATFLIRDSRPVLVLADNTKDAAYWKFDAEWLKLFRCEIQEVDKVKDWGRDEFDRFAVICLVNVANPSATRLWGKLTEWVERGGGLVVVPGGEGWQPDVQGYSDDDARKLLPGIFASEDAAKVPERQPGIPWEKELRHPMLKLLRDWQSDEQVMWVIPGQEPRVVGYWRLKPQTEDNVVLRYDDKDKTPAMLERAVGQGRVIMLTTSFDGKRETASQRPWTNYASLQFSYVFEWLLLQYLAGESDDPSFNYQPGQAVPVVFPPGSPVTLFGPGLSNAESAIQRDPVKQTTAEIDQAVSPGNYYIVGKDREGQTQVFSAFSVNPDPRESKLTRTEISEIEKVLGEGSVVPVKYSDDLLSVLNERWPAPVELLPYFMLLVLLAFAAEGLFSNLFYRRDDRLMGKTEEQGGIGERKVVEGTEATPKGSKILAGG